MITLILAGIAGVLFHCLLKLNHLLNTARLANMTFHAWKDYWVKDAVSIFLSFLSVGIWYLTFGEISAKYPALEGYSITSFVVMGAMGSYIIQLALSTAQKRINKVIDTKTDIADNKK